MRDRVASGEGRAHVDARVRARRRTHALGGSTRLARPEDLGGHVLPCELGLGLGLGLGLVFGFGLGLGFGSGSGLGLGLALALVLGASARARFAFHVGLAMSLQLELGARSPALLPPEAERPEAEDSNTPALSVRPSRWLCFAPAAAAVAFPLG